MKKELYDEKGIPTEECAKISEEFKSFMFPLFAKYTSEGVTPRELMYIMFDTAKSLEAQFLLSELNLGHLRFT